MAEIIIAPSLSVMVSRRDWKILLMSWWIFVRSLSIYGSRLDGAIISCSAARRVEDPVVEGADGVHDRLGEVGQQQLLILIAYLREVSCGLPNMEGILPYAQRPTRGLDQRMPAILLGDWSFWDALSEVAPSLLQLAVPLVAAHSPS